MTPKTATNTPDGEGLKRLSKQIDQAFEAVAKLSGSNLPPTDFYQQFLSRVLSGTDAHAGAIWLRTPQGFLQIQTQIHLDKVGLDDKKGGRQMHNELLRRVFQAGRAVMLEPYGKLGGEDGAPAANMSEFLVILAPIVGEDGQPCGLLEIWQEPYIDSRIHPTYMNYLAQMAGYASTYIRNVNTRRNTGTEQVYSQLENFSRLVHSSLNPTEVAFQIANEGRRIIGCDRISVGVRHGRKTKVEAVSGADIVERASTHIKRMRKLFDAVIGWGEQLVYNGTRDETLPPAVGDALDAYLAESNPTFLVLSPLRDDREKPKTKDEKPKKVRSGILMENFEPPEKVEPLIQKFEVISNHAAPALYNAAQMKRIPLKLIWKPVAILQDGMGSKARFWTFTIVGILVALSLVMAYVPYPLKLEAKGQLLPAERHHIYAQRPGSIVAFKVNPGDIIRPSTPLVLMRDPQLNDELLKIEGEIRTSDARIATLSSPQYSNSIQTAADRLKNAVELETERWKREANAKRLEDTKAINGALKDGLFQVIAPKFPPTRTQKDVPQWTVLTADFHDQLTNRFVEPNQPILRVGNKNGAWEIELKIPQKNIGHIRQAFKTRDPDEFLEVDVLVASLPTETFKGRLYQRSLAGEAVPNRDDQNQSDPVMLAYVTVNEPDLPQIPTSLLVAGVEVHTKIRCGNHSLGYSLFHGVWEFMYEKVVFPF